MNYINESLKGHVRVRGNETQNRIEFYNDFGVAMVLTNVDADTFKAYANEFGVAE